MHFSNALVYAYYHIYPKYWHTSPYIPLELGYPDLLTIIILKFGLTYFISFIVRDTHINISKMEGLERKHECL